MIGRVIRCRGARLVTLSTMALVLVVPPVSAQTGSPSLSPPPSPVMTAPVSPAPPAIDPRGAAGRLIALRGTLEGDRLLLAELRKDVPTSREEGEEFVAQVTRLALASDPIGLGVIVSRVRESAPVWLEWRTQQYATPQEAADAYARSGAAAFDVAWEGLHDAALLTVINRLDTIIDLADAIEEGR